MRSFFLSLVLALSLLGVPHAIADHPDDPKEPLFEDQYFLGEVKQVMGEEDSEIIGEGQVIQNLLVEVQDGELEGTSVDVQHAFQNSEESIQRLEQGDRVVVLKNREFEEVLFYITDQYRTPALIGLLLAFFALTVFFTGWKGCTALIGLAFNIWVIIYLIIPQIIAGWNPLLVCFVGGLLIAVVSLYFAHGFNKRTSIALIGTLITLAIALILSMIFVQVSLLTGIGSEEAFFLQFGELGQVDLRGLLLGGIIIGALGVLDDVTTAQSAAVDEIHKANPRLPFRELYQRGLSVGKEHITSLVNTLALAYAGASLPVLLIFTISSQPLWVVFNSEFIAEELVRTLVGSVALILAVPITTLLAAWSLKRR